MPALPCRPVAPLKQETQTILQISHKIIFYLNQWNKIRSGAEFGRDEWFALYKDDWGIDDGAWVDHVYRGLFRLHPGTVSEGCITIAHNSDYALIRNALMNTELIQVPCMRSLMARGCIEVVDGGYSYTCP